MTIYPSEPKSAAEMIARYRDVKRRLNTPAPTVRSEEIALKDLETIVVFVLAVAAVTRVRNREAARRADLLSLLHAPVTTPVITPGSAAKAELRAVSEKTGVPIKAILGRERVANVAAARHEAVWRVHQVTRWSLPRVGRFFGDRDHTTVLNSLRRMEEKAALDPELSACMTRVRERGRERISSH
ncbi:DnaA-like protein [Roseiarcus fermentans]|uniref:DnaA-like protein n=1 Tax=Roseiarcus fermentans TaxID=1473586 RepID=A0A366FEE4_9HYPH|nr:helix-turn-helix domain-containing protein [Roseiarcus fermentans]RBP13062.1 DnaA-like protein [Roseiarcus fermentans]